MPITAEQLAISTGAKPQRAAMWIDPIRAAMPVFEIYTLPRIGMLARNIPMRGSV